jgi:hypothetical protein
MYYAVGGKRRSVLLILHTRINLTVYFLHWRFCESSSQGVRRQAPCL